MPDFDPAASSDSVEKDSIMPPCEEQPFCDRFRQFMDHSDLRNDFNHFYAMDADTVNVDEMEGTIVGLMNYVSVSDGIIASTLSMKLRFH